ncbi:MAG: formyltransferase family protein, partial [Armatimonadota bacterium]
MIDSAGCDPVPVRRMAGGAEQQTTDPTARGTVTEGRGSVADRDEQRDGAPALASARAGAAGRPLRNVVVTCDDPFGVPLLLHELLMQTADITAIVLAQWKGQDSARKAARKWLGAMGWGPFAQLLGRYGAVRAKGAAACFVGAWRPLTVKGVAREHAIPLVEMADINADESLAWFRSEGPDLIVSVACPQIFGKTLLELPTLGCINIHSGPLPRYRGMLPTFWVLLNNERATAVTVHFM